MCKVRKEALIIHINILKLVQKQYIYINSTKQKYIYTHKGKKGKTSKCQ